MICLQALQVNQLQQDVARYERQAEGAQQSSDSWQQTAHQLRAELVDKKKHAAEVDGMQAEVRLLKCSAFLCPFCKPGGNACLAQLAGYARSHEVAMQGAVGRNPLGAVDMCKCCKRHRIVHVSINKLAYL